MAAAKAPPFHLIKFSFDLIFFPPITSPKFAFLPQVLCLWMLADVHVEFKRKDFLKTGQVTTILMSCNSLRDRDKLSFYRFSLSSMSLRKKWLLLRPVSYTHLTLPTIYSV